MHAGRTPLLGLVDFFSHDAWLWGGNHSDVFPPTDAGGSLDAYTIITVSHIYSSIHGWPQIYLAILFSQSLTYT